MWRLQGQSEEDIANELAPAPEDPTPLSQEEEEERATLLREGFSNWNRRDFQVGVWDQGSTGCAVRLSEGSGKLVANE